MLENEPELIVTEKVTISYCVYLLSTALEVFMAKEASSASLPPPPAPPAQENKAIESREHTNINIHFKIKLCPPFLKVLFTISLPFFNIKQPPAKYLSFLVVTQDFQSVNKTGINVKILG